MSFKKLKRTPFIILGILGRGPLSGYEVQKAIKTSTGFFWQESFGQIYPALFELEKSGSVTKKLDKTSPRSREIYRITKKGQKEFSEWLAQPFQSSVERNEMLLKVFFGGQVGSQITRAHLTKAKIEAEEYLRVLDQINSQLKIKFPNESDRFFYEATVRAGIMGAETQIAWCNEISGKL